MSQIHHANWLQLRRLIPVLERHGSMTTGEVLDYGCGTSPFRGLFSQSRRYHRVDREGIDDGVHVIDPRAPLPFEASYFDVIILARVLGDIPDQHHLLCDLHRVLMPGGRMLVFEAISYPQHDLPDDYWRVLPNGLRWTAQKAGLEVTELTYLGGYFTNIALHVNVFMLGGLSRSRFFRPVASALRACTNLTCAGLDAAFPRPVLATDYFACLTKPAASSSTAVSTGPAS
ncbi:MAG: methyltransferase domain-containing protein [Pseudomonadota bacterium]